MPKQSQTECGCCFPSMTHVHIEQTRSLMPKVLPHRVLPLMAHVEQTRSLMPKALPHRVLPLMAHVEQTCSLMPKALPHRVLSLMAHVEQTHSLTPTQIVVISFPAWHMYTKTNKMFPLEISPEQLATPTSVIGKSR